MLLRQRCVASSTQVACLDELDIRAEILKHKHASCSRDKWDFHWKKSRDKWLVYNTGYVLTAAAWQTAYTFASIFYHCFQLKSAISVDRLDNVVMKQNFFLRFV